MSRLSIGVRILRVCVSFSFLLCFYKCLFFCSYFTIQIWQMTTTPRCRQRRALNAFTWYVFIIPLRQQRRDKSIFLCQPGNVVGSMLRLTLDTNAKSIRRHRASKVRFFSLFRCGSVPSGGVYRIYVRAKKERVIKGMRIYIKKTYFIDTAAVDFLACFGTPVLATIDGFPSNNNNNNVSGHRTPNRNRNTRNTNCHKCEKCEKVIKENREQNDVKVIYICIFYRSAICFIKPATSLFIEAERNTHTYTHTTTTKKLCHSRIWMRTFRISAIE